MKGSHKFWLILLLWAYLFITWQAWADGKVAPEPDFADVVWWYLTIIVVFADLALGLIEKKPTLTFLIVWSFKKLNQYLDKIFK